jgi:hypothetical protein
LPHDPTVPDRVAPPYGLSGTPTVRLRPLSALRQPTPNGHEPAP